MSHPESAKVKTVPTCFPSDFALAVSSGEPPLALADASARLATEFALGGFLPARVCGFPDLAAAREAAAGVTFSTSLSKGSP